MFLLYFDQSKSCSFAHKLLIITITFNSTQNILEITRERKGESERTSKGFIEIDIQLHGVLEESNGMNKFANL